MADILEDDNNYNTQSILLPCVSCNRTFRPEALAKHSKVCEKSLMKKRKKFDSSKQRIQGTDLAEFLPILPTFTKKADKSPIRKIQAQSSNASLSTSSKTSLNSPKSKWREKHNELVQTIKAARLPPGQAPPPPQRPLDQEPCPYCDRSFGPKAYDRHLEWCKEQQARIKPRSPASQRAKDRVEARTKYRAPLANKVKQRSASRDKYPTSIREPSPLPQNTSQHARTPSTVRKKQPTKAATESVSAPNIGQNLTKGTPLRSSTRRVAPSQKKSLQPARALKFPSPNPFLKLNSEEVNLQVPELSITGFFGLEMPPDMDNVIQNSEDTNSDSDEQSQLISTFEINIPDDFVETSTPHLGFDDGLQDDVALNFTSSQDSFDEDSLCDSAELLKPELNRTYTKEDLKDLLECNPVKSYQLNTVKNFKTPRDTLGPCNFEPMKVQEICSAKDSRDIFKKKSNLLTVETNSTKRPNIDSMKVSTSYLDLSNKQKSYSVPLKPNTVIEHCGESVQLLFDSKGTSNELLQAKSSNKYRPIKFHKVTVTYSTCKKSTHCEDFDRTHFHFCPSWAFMVKELTLNFFYKKCFQYDKMINNQCSQLTGLCSNKKSDLILLPSYNSKANTLLLNAKKYFINSNSFKYHRSDSVESNHSNTDTHMMSNELSPFNKSGVEEIILPTITPPETNQANKFSPVSVAKQNSWSEIGQTPCFWTKLNNDEKQNFTEYKAVLYWDYYGLQRRSRSEFDPKEVPDSKKISFNNNNVSYYYLQNTFVPYESISDNGSSVNSNCDDVLDSDGFDPESQSSIDGDFDKLSSSFSESTDSNYSEFQYEGDATNHHSITPLNLTKQDSRSQMKFNNDTTYRTKVCLRPLKSGSTIIKNQHSSVRTSECGEKVIFKINKCSEEVVRSSPSNHYYFKSNSAEKSGIQKFVYQKDSKQFYNDKVHTTQSIYLETVEKSVSCSNLPQSNKNHYSKLPMLNLHPDRTKTKNYEEKSKNTHVSDNSSHKLLDYDINTNKYSLYNKAKSHSNDLYLSKLPVLIDKPSKIKDTHWTEKFKQFKERERRKKDEPVYYLNPSCLDSQTNKDIYSSLKGFSVTEGRSSTANFNLDKSNRLSPIVSESISVSSSSSSLDFENNYTNFNCSEEWINKTSSEPQFCQFNTAQDSADISLRAVSDLSILTIHRGKNKSSKNETLYNQKPSSLKIDPHYKCVKPIPLKRKDCHTDLFKIERMKFPNAVKKVVTNMTRKRLPHEPEPYDPFKSAERQMLELLEPEKEPQKLVPIAKSPALVSSPTSAFTKFPSSCNTPEPLFIIEDLNINLSSKDELKSPLSSEKSYSPVSVTPLDNYSLSKDSNRNAINLSTLSLCSTISIESVDSNKNGYRMGMNSSAKVPEKKTPVPLRRTVSAYESRKSRDPLKGKLKMEDMLYGGNVIPGERYFDSPIITGKLEKYIDDHSSSGSLYKAVSDTETLNAEQELLKSMSEFEKLLSSSSSSPSPSSPPLKLFPSLVSSYQTGDQDKHHEMDLHPISHIGGPDSAYSSLNRKSPVGGEQERDFPESPGVAKFCHECGTKYPMLAAKFCCQCGIRRLII